MLPTNQASSLSSERWLIPINIETLVGSSFELLVSPHEQIQSIKRRIEQREGIPVSQQHLVWKSIELEDESCLNDYHIEAGTTLKLVLNMRGGPVNTKRVPIEDSLIRDVSEYIESSRDDCDINSDLVPSSNKNVTFLVLRDGDQYNFFQVIDRGDGTLSPLSGSVSNASMYNTHETLTVEPEREYDEKRQADDRKTKQKMELIRTKLKTHARKDAALPMRPPSATKQTKPTSLTQTLRRTQIADKSSVSTTRTNQASVNSSLDTTRSLPMVYSSTNILNSYNILTNAAMRGADLLHEEDTEDEDDSHDEDDEQPTHLQSQSQLVTSSSQPGPYMSMNSKKTPMLTSRSFSPAVFYQKKPHHHQYEQETSTKKSLYHSNYQERTTKNLVSKHDSTGSLDSYAPNSINTILSTSYPSVGLGPVTQETAMTTTGTATTAGNDASTGAVLVDYIPRISPTLHKQQVPMVARSSRILSAISSKRLTTSEDASTSTTTTTNIDILSTNQQEMINSNSEILYQQSRQSPILGLLDDERNSPRNGLTSATSILAEKIETSRKQTAELQSRNETSLSRPIWTDDDDQLMIGDDFIPGEGTSTSQSMLFHHRNSSTSTTVATPAPTFPSVVKKSTLPSATQQFYHHHKPLNSESQSNKASPRSTMPLNISKYRRMQTNVHLTNSSQATPTYSNAAKVSSNDLSNSPHANPLSSTDSFNEHLMLNKRIEILKTPGKQPQSTAPSPSSSSTTTVFPSTSTLTKRHVSQQESKTTGATTTVPPTSNSSHNPLDNTTVTIESIGPKTVSALLRQKATIEPVDTSRGVGKHLYSLLTTVSRETTAIKTGYKHGSRDAVLEERFKLDSKTTTTGGTAAAVTSTTTNPWSTTSTNPSTVSSSLQSTTATIFNTNKLPPVNVNRKSTSKCFLCKKKTGLATTYQCRCGSSFCSEHRYPEAHACAFDYKAEGKRLIERNNPLVTAPKLPKI